VALKESLFGRRGKIRAKDIFIFKEHRQARTRDGQGEIFMGYFLNIDISHWGPSQEEEE